MAPDPRARWRFARGLRGWSVQWATEAIGPRAIFEFRLRPVWGVICGYALILSRKG
jgi:hypothetical protein